MTATAGSPNDTRSVLRAVRRAVSVRRQQHHERAQRLSADSLERRLLEGRADELADLVEVISDLEAYVGTDETAAEPNEPTVTVEELAAAIGQTVGATRRLLNRNLIPGARRFTPGIKNSPWIIPASAASRYLASFNRNGQ